MKRLLNKELKLMLLLSRVNPDGLVLEKAQELVNSYIHWDSFMSLSAGQGVSALIYKNIIGLKNIPDDNSDRFKNSYFSTLRSNIQLVSEIDRLLDGLNRRGVDVILLKGPTTSEKIFGDMGLYPSGDIDILVKVEDIDRIKEYLEHDGYKMIDNGFDEYREYFIKELYHFTLSNRRFVIEPHWNLFFRYFTTPPQFWWEESITVMSENRQYRFLSPEKNILYNSFRLFSKAFTPLRFLIMIAELIRHYRNEIDWEKLFAFAHHYKFENVLRVTLKLSHELLGAPVPVRYAAIQGFRVRLLYKYPYWMVIKGGDQNPLNKVLFTFLRDDLSGALRVLFRRLFPSMGEIVSRYRLPVKSGKAYIYYLLNPLMLLMSKHQK